MQMPFGIQLHADLFRIEAEGSEPFTVNRGQKTAVVRHELLLFAGELYLAEFFDFFFNGLEKILGVDSLVPVLKGECAFGVWKQLDIGIRSGELV